MSNAGYGNHDATKPGSATGDRPAVRGGATRAPTPSGAEPRAGGPGPVSSTGPEDESRKVATPARGLARPAPRGTRRIREWVESGGPSMGVSSNTVDESRAG